MKKLRIVCDDTQPEACGDLDAPSSYVRVFMAKHTGKPGFVVTSVNINSAIATRHGVTRVPTFLFLDDGNELIRLVDGKILDDTIENHLKDLGWV